MSEIESVAASMAMQNMLIKQLQEELDALRARVTLLEDAARKAINYCWVRGPSQKAKEILKAVLDSEHKPGGGFGG